MSAGGALELSVVIPVKDEEPNLPLLHQELTQALGDSGISYEVVIVDDGSTDGTFAQLEQLYERDPRIRVIRFVRNFGQTAAFAAGFDAARGRFVATLDGDLQNDPADIPRLLALAPRVALYHIAEVLERQVEGRPLAGAGARTSAALTQP